jgi:hypothetical protein
VIKVNFSLFCFKLITDQSTRLRRHSGHNISKVSVLMKKHVKRVINKIEYMLTSIQHFCIASMHESYHAQSAAESSYSLNYLIPKLLEFYIRQYLIEIVEIFCWKETIHNYFACCSLDL